MLSLSMSGLAPVRAVSGYKLDESRKRSKLEELSW
jgi:hypothetical protein